VVLFLTVLLCSGGVAAAQMVERLSLRSDGTQGNAASSGPSVSADGRCVAFYSDSTNLLSRVGGFGDTNSRRDVFLSDRVSGELQRVSVSSAGEQANGHSQNGFRPAIDDGCTCVAFSSDATNLVPDDTNGQQDVFVRDLVTSTTIRASVGQSGEGNSGSSFPSVSGNCQLIAYHSTASNLVSGDSNNSSDVFVFSRGTGQVSRVSVGPSSQEANGGSITPSISGDGRCVAFASAATNLGFVDTNRKTDIYVACDGEVTCRASVNSAGVEANGDSFLPALNNDGTIVAFKSLASNLVSDDHNGAADVFVHDCVTGETERVSVGVRGEGNDNSFPPTISGDGRMVAFGSFASNLLSGISTGGNAQVYVHNRITGTTQLASMNLSGVAANGSAPDIPPSISRNGRWVAFASLATDLVLGDTNGAMDVFINASPMIMCETNDDCPEGEVCVDDVCVPVTPTPTSTATATPVPTSTPTPGIPCFFDQDCPVGQVCIDGECMTVPCETDVDCPGGRMCVDGICQPIVMTPTPLPTCTTDEDCPEPDRCRAMVCVPPRVCDDENPEIDRLECRGVRETCLNGTCECGGDCNLDGIVFGNEITIAVNILGDPSMTPLSQCPAADIVFPLDGTVMANEITLAVINLGLGCPGEGLPLELARNRTEEVRTIEVGSVTSFPGRTVTVPVSISGGEEVATVQFDLLFDTAVLTIDNPGLACALDQRLVGDGRVLVAFRPQVPPAPPGKVRLRLAVLDLGFPIDSFGDGPILSCTFGVRPDAPLGTFELVDTPSRRQVADAVGNVFGNAFVPGTVTIEQEECDMDEDCPEGFVCRDGVCVFGECSGPTAGPTECAEGRETCVDNFCECSGDCNGDGFVTPVEIATAVQIFGDVLSVSACPAADQNGNGAVTPVEIALSVTNFGMGCPNGGQ
jgi:Tol biopolymer transport system component